MGDFKPFRGAGCSLAAVDVEMIICHLFLNHDSINPGSANVAAVDPYVWGWEES